VPLEQSEHPTATAASVAIVADAGTDLGYHLTA